MAFKLAKSADGLYYTPLLAESSSVRAAWSHTCTRLSASDAAFAARLESTCACPTALQLLHSRNCQAPLFCLCPAVLQSVQTLGHSEQRLRCVTELQCAQIVVKRSSSLLLHALTTYEGERDWVTSGSDVSRLYSSVRSACKSCDMLIDSSCCGTVGLHSHAECTTFFHLLHSREGHLLRLCW